MTNATEKKKKKYSFKGHNVQGIRRMSKERFLLKIDVFDLISVAFFFASLPTSFPSFKKSQS